MKLANTTPAERTCKRCGVLKPIDGFQKRTKISSGVTYYTFTCKECSCFYAKNLYYKDLEVNREKAKTRYQKSETYRLQSRNSYLQRAYGITVDEYNAIALLQNYQCAICGSQQKDKALAVDHDHATGTIRQLLCDQCNFMVGYTEKCGHKLHLVIGYLEKHGAIQTAN